MQKYDVVVVGAGNGGLAAAACLAKAGKRVLLLVFDNNVGVILLRDCFTKGGEGEIERLLGGR